jgi:hypothetical protein
MTSILLAAIGAFITLFGVLTLFSDAESGPPNYLYSSTTIAIGILLVGAGWLFYRRRHHNFDNQLQTFAGGSGRVTWTRVYLLSNRLGMLFTRSRALAYSNGSLALISPNGDLTAIPLTVQTRIEHSEPYLAITTPDNLYIVADVSMWKALLLMLGASGVQSSAIGSASGSAAASSVGAGYAQNNLNKLFEWSTTTDLRIAEMSPDHQSTLNYRGAIAITWAIAILFTGAGILVQLEGSIDSQSNLLNAEVWAIVFAIILVGITIWRISRKIQPSIIKSFSNKQPK